MSSVHVAVDFDGTLAHDGGHPFTGSVHPDFDPLAEVTGEPIWPMVDRINDLREAGYEVRILTARDIFEPVHRWLVRHLGYDLPVSNVKQAGMLMLLDDRCARVERNTGRVCQCYQVGQDVRNIA